MCAERRQGRRAQRGLSIVEIMVGMVVALLVSLAAGGGAAVFSAGQRQGIGTAGITANAGSALAAIKSDVASAGLGFSGDASFQCYALNLSVGNTLHFNGASFAPMRITAGTSSDQLDVVYASSIDSGANVLIKGSTTGTAVNLMSLLPVAVGDTVLLSPATPSAARPCVVRTVTAVTAATDEAPQALTFAASGSHNGAAFTTVPTFTEDPGKDRVALLGRLQWSRFRVSTGNLVLERPLDASGASAILMRNVMTFRAQYGIANAGSMTLTGWQSATDDSSGTTGVNWSSLGGASVDRVHALRIGIVTRSAQREKEGKSGACEASAAKPVLFGATVQPDVTDWACYRYRTAVVVVPLRNLNW